MAALLSFAAVPEGFAPLEQWSAAVTAGDATAVRSLYQSAANVLADQRPVELAQEVAFWSGLKNAGLGNFQPKVLSIKQEGSQATLVLRVQGTLGGKPFVMSLAQQWVNDGGGWRVAASNRSQLVADTGRRLPEPAKPNPTLYPPPSDAQQDLHAALKTAAAQHKRVLVVFGANWCYDCHVLDATFRSAQFAHLVQANYVVVHINLGDEGKDNNDLATKFGVNLDHGIPSLAVLDSSGKVLEAQQNGEFENTVRIGPQDVRAFLEKWKP